MVSSDSDSELSSSSQEDRPSSVGSKGSPGGKQRAGQGEELTFRVGFATWLPLAAGGWPIVTWMAAMGQTGAGSLRIRPRLLLSLLNSLSLLCPTVLSGEPGRPMRVSGSRGSAGSGQGESCHSDQAADGHNSGGGRAPGKQSILSGQWP